MIGSEDERVNQDVGTPREGPRTEAGRALAMAGHRTDDIHDCFALNCRALGHEVRELRESAMNFGDGRSAAAWTPTQMREALIPAIHEMYVDGTLEPTATALLSEVVDRIIASLRDKETAK